MTRQDYLDGKVTFEEYYTDLAKQKGIAITKDNLKVFGLNDIWDLKERFQRDPNLNNIPLRRFDNLTHSFNTFHPKLRMALSEGTCIYKTLLKNLLKEVKEWQEELIG